MVALWVKTACLLRYLQNFKDKISNILLKKFSTDFSIASSFVRIRNDLFQAISTYGCALNLRYSVSARQKIIWLGVSRLPFHFRSCAFKGYKSTS